MSSGFSAWRMISTCLGKRRSPARAEALRIVGEVSALQKPRTASTAANTIAGIYRDGASMGSISRKPSAANLHHTENGRRRHGHAPADNRPQGNVAPKRG